MLHLIKCHFVAKESKFDLHSFSHKSTDYYFKKKLAYTQFKQALVENNIDSSEVILTSHKVVMNIMNGIKNKRPMGHIAHLRN